jgi:hypothetical protein
MSTTRTHRLKFSGGRALFVDVTEASDAVHIAIRGPKLDLRDVPRFMRLMQPIVAPFDQDRRPLSVCGEHANWTGMTVPHGAGFAALRVPNPRGRN